MAVTTQKIGYNQRGVWSSSVADYKILDTVTFSSGGITSLYEVISPAYPGSVPVATPVSNTTYFRLIAEGVQGPIGDTGAAGLAATITVVSVPSQSIGTGTKTFTYSGYTNLQFSIGQRVRASYSSVIYMEGTITSYNSTSMVVNVDRVSGSGAYTGWSIGVTGDVGATGSTGTAGLTATIAVTSSTSNSIAVGSKTFTFTSVPNLGWAIGTRLRAYNSSTTYMEGEITSFLSTSVTINVTYIVGTGTFTSWFLSIAGDVGATPISEVPSGGATGQSLTLVGTVKTWAGGILTQTTVSVPTRAGGTTSNPVTYSQTLGTPNTLTSTLNSGNWVVPFTGVYDLFVDGRPVIVNTTGGIYGYAAYALHIVSGSQLLVAEGNFPVNGTIGIVVQGVAMGVSLTAGQNVRFEVSHWSGTSAGELQAHTATIRYLLRR